MKPELIPQKKRYFSRVPGSVYTFADGRQIQFAFGRFDFDPEDYKEPFFVGTINNNAPDPRNGMPSWMIYQQDLENLVNTNNPLIFAQGTNPDVQLPDGLNPAKNAASEADIAMADSQLRKGNFRETGDVNTGTAGTVTDVNASTVDNELRKVVMKEATGPGAKRIAEMRTQTQNAQNPNGMG